MRAVLQKVMQLSLKLGDDEAYNEFSGVGGKEVT
jgi:hypothetical protein